ncbi:MAG: PASTA domain-containing protein [Gemmatimonadota bacterium]|nr:MAG: PASTA domain-containing protein [Gemmatimonadota bacterium]
MAKPVVRLGAVKLAFFAMAAIVLVRAAQVQLWSGAGYAREALEQRTAELPQPAPRGTIYDRNGEVLAESIERFRIDITPSEFDPTRSDEQIINLMSRNLGLSWARIRRELRKTYGYFGGPFSSTQVENLRGINGIHLTSEFERSYRGRDLATVLIGRPREDGRTGSGIELILDTLLAGTDGRKVVIKDSRGRKYESPARPNLFPEPGHDVYLTLDAGLQEIAEDALDEALQQYDAESGDVVVLEPATGRVLALASRYVDGTPTSRAIDTPFEPGSTAKVFAAAALILHERAGWDTLVWAENGEWVTEHRTIRDEHENGWLSLEQVIEQSSNIGIVKLAERLKPEEQYQMLRDFGIGSRTGIEFPSESPGSLKRPSDWSGITGQSMAMGYEINVTPLQLAQAYGAIANDGIMMRPTLIGEVVTPDGKVVYRHAPEPVRRVVPPWLARQLRSALRGVVYEDGTGKSAALEGYEVGGKTGTAWLAGPNGYDRESYTASFTSLFPADDPQIVMVVKLDKPKGSPYAAVNAVPLTKAVLEQLLAAETSVLDRSQLVSKMDTMAGRRIEPPGEVAVTLTWPPGARQASGADTCRVPDVTGLSLRAAARELHRMGLRIKTLGLGDVAGTNPAAGSLVTRGAVVTVSTTGTNRR